MKYIKASILPTLCLAIALTSGAAYGSTIVVSDTLQRGGPPGGPGSGAYIQGTAPDTTDLPGTTYYTGIYDSIKTTSAGANVQYGAEITSLNLGVGFNPGTVHTIYTLSVTVSNSFVGDGNFFLGFDNQTVEATTDGGTPNFNDFVGPSVQLRADGWSIGHYTAANDGTAFAYHNIGSNSTGTNDLKLVLDTTGADWVVSSYINGIEYGTYTYTSGNPSIDSIAFGGGVYDKNADVADFTNLQLTVAPEPSTWALMAFGLGALGFFHRQRNRRA